MKPTTTQLMAYSREFFVRSKRALDRGTSYDLMESVMRGHNAIEYCIRAVISEQGTYAKKQNANLFELMDLITKDTNKPVPERSRIGFINDTRVNVKHRASIPSLEDAQRCFTDASVFLDQAAKEYFKVEFSSISRVMLVEVPDVRGHLENAEKYAQQNDYLEALIEIKTAYIEAEPSEDEFIEQDMTFTKFFVTSDLQRLEMQTQFRTLVDTLGRIVDKIVSLEKKTARIMMGLDVTETMRFDKITPHISYHGMDQRSISWYPDQRENQEMVDEAMTYVIDMVLKWQQMGVLDFITTSYRPKPIHPHRRMDYLRTDRWEPPNWVLVRDKSQLS